MERNLSGSEETRDKQSGRRKYKSNESTQKKKQPQRGMGVEKLERLRLQERWKKITEINPVHSFGVQNHHVLPSSFADPTAPTAGPIRIAKYGSYGVMSGVGQSALSHALFLQRLGNGGFHGQVGSSVVAEVASGVDLYGIGAPNSNFGFGNVTETSKELSSMPNMKCYCENCAVCHKKKRINGENLGCNAVTVRDTCAGMSPMINSRSFAEFNVGNNRTINGENQDSFMKAHSLDVYAGRHNMDQEVEVVAVHRKGSSGGGSVFMEYEFFPEKCDRSTCYKELMKLGSESSSVAAVGGKSYCATATTSSGVDASNSIDLSLKLSY